MPPAQDRRTQSRRDVKKTEAGVDDSERVSAEPVGVASSPRPPNKVTVLLQPHPPKPDYFNKWLLVAAFATTVVGATWVVTDMNNGAKPTPSMDPAGHPQAEVEQRSEPLTTRTDRTELPESVKRQLAEAERLRNAAERLKQLELEHQRTLEQAEELQRERDAALAKAQAEEEQRARDAERAKQAIEREKAAARALATEKAAQAEKQRLARQQLNQEKSRLEQVAREQERQRLEQDAQKQEQLRLEQEAREQEQLRLDQEARERELLEQRRLAWEQKLRAARGREEKSAEQAEKEKNAGFSTDPCAGPTARFVSTCPK